MMRTIRRCSRLLLGGSAAVISMLSVMGDLGSAYAQGPGSTLNYERVDLAVVAKEISDRTKRTFVLDPRLSGTVTIVSPAGVLLSPDEVWEVFLATLEVNNFAAVPIGDKEYKIVPTQQAIKDGGSNGGMDSGGATVTQVVPLRFVDARTAAANLRGLISDSAVVTAIAETNSLIVVDRATNVQRILSVLEELDVDESIVRTIALENAAASEVASTLVEIINSTGVDGRRLGGVSVVAVDTSNTVILRGPAQEVQRLEPLVSELDARGNTKIALDHIYLNHADAEELVPIIKELLGASMGEGAAPAPGNPTVAFHKPTNSLIVNAPPDLQRTIRAIVSRLDIRRPQVQIEAVVVELSNARARELGVQYISGGDNIPVSAASFTGTSPNIVSAAGAAYFLGPGAESNTRTITRIDPNTGQPITETEEVFDQNDPTQAISNQLVTAAVGDLLSFNGFLFGAADQTDDGVYGVLLSAIQSDSASNVLNVPSIVLLDNEAGQLQVGQEIPIVTGQATGDDFQNSFRTVERRDVGNILEVTPKINAGNTVELQIRLEISSIGAFTALTDDIITNKNVVEVSALAEDGQTIVIGGLIDRDQRNTETKVPVLGDIPLLGNLFKGQTRQNEETTLMIFIRPTIMRDAFQADGVTARKYDYVRQQQMRRLRTKEAPIDDVMLNYLGAGNYIQPGLPQPTAQPPMPIGASESGGIPPAMMGPAQPAATPFQSGQPQSLEPMAPRPIDVISGPIVGQPVVGADQELPDSFVPLPPQQDGAPR